MGKDKRKSSQLSQESFVPFLEPLQAIHNLLLMFGDQGVIIGGVAASLLGTPRYTVDLDAVVLINLEDIPKFLQEAARQGIEPRIPDAEKFAQKNRVLLLRHSASVIDIDISLGVLPFEIEMVKRSNFIELSGIKLRIPTPEDLIIMKAVAHRAKDWIDIHAIATSHPGLDREHIRIWVEQFGEALDDPGLWSEVEKLLRID